MFVRSAFLLGVLVTILGGCTCAEPGVTCTTEQDCTNPAAQKCDQEVGLCVACVVDEHCSEGFVCANGACEAGCRTDTDRCPTGFCKAGVGCVSCVVDSQCGAGQVCANNSCVPGCSAQNPTCPSGLVCDASLGRCVECVNNAQCPNAPLTVCDPTTSTCVQCAANSDCTNPLRPVCDPATNTCVTCLSNADCPNNGVCNMNRCVQCLSDAQCGGLTPRCNLTSNTCVACLPGATDNCPTGQYCRPDFRCEQGCKTGMDCPSGVCLPNHNCQGCTSDSQCAAGNVCNNGTCVGACSATTPCGSGQTCCNGRCEALANDRDNCGACGRACNGSDACCNGTCNSTTTLTNCGACGVTCGADQFCDGAQCQNKVFPNFCANRNVVAIRDGVALDNAATTTLASTITQYCSANTTITFADDTDPQVVDQDGGALLLGGGYTVVTAGGPFPNLPVKWLERTKRVTKVYFSNNLAGTEFYFKKRLPADAGMADPIVVTRLQSACSAALVDGGVAGQASDTFLVELAIDPASGTLALIAYGLCSPGAGTNSAAWYWANVMLPNRSTYTDSWYIYDWNDTNGNGAPDI
ncbi:MAG TPA: hypothetical protein VGE37_16900, partial [Archangium sp.]